MTPTDQWEHAVLHDGVNAWERMTRRLVRLGAEGWECVGITGGDKTVGMNALFAVVKRRVVPPQPPDDAAKGWKPDPCGRWQVRHWSGSVWTAHVARETGKPGGKTGIDAPQTLPPSDLT